MNYNFDKLIERRKTSSLKWDVKENELPMWVADMDFQTAPEIITAIHEKAEHGIYGYTTISKEWYQSIIGWWKLRHNFTIERDWLVFSTGVVPAISSIIRKMTTPGENILVQTPVYHIFFNSIVNNGRRILENKLKFRGTEYEIDFCDLEEKLADPQTTMMILCNPHNPIGKIWDREVLERIGSLCKQYHVIVLSDEIHCDITEPGFSYTPFASVSEECRQISITCLSPSKAFNIAGLQTSAVMIPNKNLRHKVNRALNTDEVAEPNAFAIEAVIAAFSHGEKWLDELRKYLWENRRFAEKFLEEEIGQIKVVGAHATYLLWLDCTKLIGNSNVFTRFLHEYNGLLLSSGSEFLNGEGFLRVNIACPKERLKDGLFRLRDGLTAYKTWSAEQC